MGAKLRIIGVYGFLTSSSRHAVRRSTSFLEKFIRKVLITDPVLSSIGAFELMVFQNRIDQLDFPDQQHTALDMLKDFIILKSITVIEHDDLFFREAIFNNEPDLAMFRYKKEDKKIVSH